MGRRSDTRRRDLARPSSRKGYWLHAVGLGDRISFGRGPFGNHSSSLGMAPTLLDGNPTGGTDLLDQASFDSPGATYRELHLSKNSSVGLAPLFSREWGRTTFPATMLATFVLFAY
jgi:hypothetical protein